MGGFLGIGNSSAKTDRGNQLGGINAEWNVYNRGLPLADEKSSESTQTTNSGISSLEDAKKYWQSIMSGDTNATMKAAAPAINTINEASDAQRAQQAEMGTSRGGGVNATNQAAESNRVGKVEDVLAGQPNEAAKGVQSVGTAEAAVGSNQMREALAAMGLSDDVAKEIIDSSIQSRPISQNANAAVRQQWSNFLGALGF